MLEFLRGRQIGVFNFMCGSVGRVSLFGGRCREAQGLGLSLTVSLAAITILGCDGRGGILNGGRCVHFLWMSNPRHTLYLSVKR